MARSVATIQAQIVATYVSATAAIGVTVDPTQWSATNITQLIFYVVAFCINVLEQLFDVFTGDVNTALAQMTAHTLLWYANIAKAYEYGIALLPDSDQFNNTGYTGSQITASQVVNYAAVIEQQNQYGRTYLRMKLATMGASDLQPLTSDQMTGFGAYMALVKDAGVPLQITSTAPDSIKQTWRIFYDPLILNATGSRLDGTSSTPVQDAIQGYLTQLPFNGIYVIEYHINAVMAVPGVVTLDLDSCETQYGSLPFSPVDTLYTPDAGYLRFADPDTDLLITWIPQQAIQ